MTLRIDIVMDLPESAPGHVASVAAIGHAIQAVQAADPAVSVESHVVRTASIDDAYLAQLPDGLMIGPGGPYDEPVLVEALIGEARRRDIPLVGT